jgi:DNA-binding CsgD family transcriptional regulator
MGQRFHRGFTAAEKTELWDRWKRGESLKAIGRAFGKPSSSIYFLVAPHGGIRPAQRRRSRLALTLAEREVISRGVTAHQSVRSIARLLGRAPSTVSREMSRNGGYDRYRATLADENDVSQPISPPALAPPPVQSRVCPGYRIERTELRAAGGADSGFARIKLSSPWRNRNCPDSINWFNKRAVGRGRHAIRLLRCSRTLQRGSGVLLSTNRLLF